MRIFENASIKDEFLTGFQSPASEFAQKPVSFDERYDLGNPSIKLLDVQRDFPQFGIRKGDRLLVDLSKRPGPVSLVVTIMDDEIHLLQGNKFKDLDLVCGVVKVIIRDFELSKL
jgi:hypothetical protein